METDTRALLLAKMDPPPDHENEWNNWYSNRHCADRLSLPGFLSGRRFTKIEGVPRQTFIGGEAKYLALYDLQNIGALNSEPYRKLRETESKRGPDSFDVQVFKLPKFARGAYKQIFPVNESYTVPRSQYLFAVGHEVPPGKEDEFNVWYNTEHIPALMQVPGFLTVRRFVLEKSIVLPLVERGGTLPQYLTLYDIKDEKAFETETFLKASNTPWTLWVRSWYTRKMCMFYRKIYPQD